MNDLFPRAPRRMQQPRKDKLREELARAASTIEQQRHTIDYLERANEITRFAANLNRPARPWWRRIFRSKAA
ncbi:hypothetical protein [Lysobacter sp. F6437]|uniref:hypothetical protein n=1 Tax=Lysobacter sp. F6437 TaxID=3459296 RepID=UPI00403E19D3